MGHKAELGSSPVVLQLEWCEIIKILLNRKDWLLSSSSQLERIQVPLGYI
jgi:hypothetical protein